MVNVPMDVARDIFLRLPAKSLVKFRALSKLYCSMIDAPDFIRCHLNLTNKTGDHRMILLRGALHLYSVDLDTLDSVTDVEHPFNSSPSEVFGSANGLLGVSKSDTELALYNPSTRRFHLLPVSPVDLPDGCFARGYVFYGFGYDSVNDDYKVLRMVQFKADEDDELGHAFPYEVMVYSLKTNSWRSITTKLIHLQFLFYFYYHLMFRRGYGVFAGNNLHWVLPQRPGLIIRKVVIVGFDLGTEMFWMVSEPESIGELNEEVQLDLGVLDGNLCLMCNYNQDYVDVWVMKAYGVKESWTKLFTVQRPRTAKCFAYLKPLVYSKDGEKVLLDVSNRKLQWFDLKSKKLTTVRIEHCPSSFSAEVATSSLVLGCVGDRIGEQQAQQQRKEQENKSWNRKKRDKFLSQGFKLVL